MTGASVVVALNPHDNELAAVARGYATQTPVRGGFEVVIVDNGARPDVAHACEAIRREHPSLRLRRVQSSLPGRAAANNAGARAADSDLLIFVADDFVPARNLVRAHVDFHAFTGSQSVGIGPAFFTGEARMDPFRRWLEDSGSLFGVPFRIAGMHWPRHFFYAGNASMSRALFERAGGFDEGFLHDTLDDLEFGERLRELHVPTHYLPKAHAWHDHRLTLDERREIMRKSGEAAAALEDRKPGRWPWAPLVERCSHDLAAAPAHTVAGNDSYRDVLDLAFATGYRQYRSRVLPLPVP
jgi:GT2 family glycosyltransferase